MNILMFDFGSYIQPDMLFFLEKAGHHCNAFYYDLREQDHVHNDAFEALLLSEWEKGDFDLVFSTNFFPVIAYFCQTHDCPYVSWSYDCPLDLETDEGFDLPCNSIFLYDKKQAESYRARGIDTVYHLPLAVNCDRLSAIRPDPSLSCEISFLGTLYESTYPVFKSHMGEYETGYLDALARVQSDLYGLWLVDDLITQDLCDKVNQAYRSASADAVQLTVKQLSWSLATHITHLNRLSLLRLLSAQHDVLLCTKVISEADRRMLPDVRIHDALSYVDEMPSLFRSSKINLNMSLRAIRTGIPLRALDIMGSGSFLLSNYQEELAEALIPGEEVVLYESLEDAVEKAGYYLSHEAERKMIASKGLEKMRRDFRYEDRIRVMFDTAGLSG